MKASLLAIPRGFWSLLVGMRVTFRVHPAEGDEPPYPVFTPAEGTP